jgi:hypothetical protein
MKKEELLKTLSNDVGPILPVFVISYGRPEFLARDFIAGLSVEFRSMIYVVVRESEYWDYHSLNEGQGVKTLFIPNDYPVHHIGSTRQFVLEKAAEWGLTHFWMWDDDLLNIYPMFTEYFQGVFRLMEDSLPIVESTLRWMNKLFIEATDQHQDVCLASPWSGAQDRYQRSRLSIKYAVNRWWNQWQMIGYHLPAIQRLDAFLDLPAADEIAEDLYQVFKVLRNGGQVATFPQIVAEFDYDAPSTLGDKDQKKARRNREEETYRALLGERLADIYKVNVRYPDGSVMYSGVNWKKFYEITGTGHITVRS